MNINKKAKSFYGFVIILVYALIVYVYYQYNENKDDIKFQTKQNLEQNMLLIIDILKTSNNIQEKINSLKESKKIDYLKLLDKNEKIKDDEKFFFISKIVNFSDKEYLLVLGKSSKEIDDFLYDKMFEHIIFASILILYIFPFISTIRTELKNDAKEQLNQQKAMAQQQKLIQMGELLNNISHQWRQPLSSINSTVASIEKSFYKNELDEKTLDDKLLKIEATTQFLSNTIEDFRNYFKTNKPKEHFFISECIKNTQNILSSTIEKNHINIKLEILNDKELFLPKGEYTQVVMAIISNAIEQLVLKNTTKPTIFITINDELIIEDNAGGIKEEFLEKVFDLDFSTKLDKKGSGLGLYMSKMLVENSFNSKITVSNGEYGALFKIIC